MVLQTVYIQCVCEACYLFKLLQNARQMINSLWDVSLLYACRDSKA